MQIARSAHLVKRLAFRRPTLALTARSELLPPDSSSGGCARRPPPRAQLSAVPCTPPVVPPDLHAKQPAKSARCVVRLGTVVIHEHPSIASIAEEGAAEGADVRR